MAPPVSPKEAGDFLGDHSESDGEGGRQPPAVPPHTPNRRSGSQDHAKRGSQQRASSRKPPQIRGVYSTDYDAPSRTRSTRPNRPLRYDDRDEWDDEYCGDRDHDYDRERSRNSYRERDDQRNPDTYNRRSVRTGSRPPRAYLNRPYFDEPVGPSPSPSKPWFEETTSAREVRLQDEEMGMGYSSGVGGQRVDWKQLSTQEKAEVLRLPWTQWMNSNMKNHFVASMGEFIGTTLFLFFAFAGTEVANIQSKANSSKNSNDSNTTTGAETGFDIAVLLYISIIFGFSLMVNVWIFFRISGGLFNPAVTLAMAMVKAISVTRAVCLFIAQMLGSLLASVIVRFLFPENFNVRTTLSGGATAVQGVFIEAILTAELVFCIFMLAKEKHRATFIAPVGIGLALFIAEMVGVQFTGGSLNPARSFGPCVVTLTFDEEHWIYWIGPVLGSLIAVMFYKFIKTLEYEMANPGADGDPTNDPTINPEKRAELPSARASSSRG